MNIQGVQQQLRDFATARDWQPFHSPKNLAMALMVEAAELLELFQWLTTEQSHTLTKASEDKEKVADEIADVMLYLLQIADRTEVNLEEAVQKKIVKNTEKYPAKHPEVLSSKAKVHLLVDWENVQPDVQALKQLEPEGSDVWLFHAPAQYLAAQKQQKAYGSNSVTLVERSGAGKNALDFQLSYYAGYLMARQPEARFVVISNDKGYEPMLEHARKLKFQAQRQGYQKPPGVKNAVAVTQQATPPTTKQAATQREPQRPALAPANLLPVLGAKALLKKYTQKVQVGLEKAAAARPVKRDALLRWMYAHIILKNDAAITAEKILSVLQALQVVKITRAGQVSYPKWEGGGRSQPQQSSKTSLAVKKKVVKRTNVAQKQAGRPKTAATKNIQSLASTAPKVAK